MKPRGIIVFGASGGGATTLGKALAARLGFAHLDVDEYYWDWDAPVPYTVSREREIQISMLLADIERSGNFVMSGNIRNMDGPFRDMLDLAVFMDTPTEIRLARIKAREYALFGERVVSGDMADEHRAFVEWAARYDLGDRPGRSRRNQAEWAAALPCPAITADGARPTDDLAREVAERFYTKPGEPWRVYTADLNALGKYRYTVIFARHQGKWLYCRQKGLDTWETAGGHIDPGETPLEGAKRELWEETGAADYAIAPAFDYAAHRDREFAYGQVFIADITRLGDLPDSEMAETRLFDGMPERMTYPFILPVLFDRIQRA